MPQALAPLTDWPKATPGGGHPQANPQSLCLGLFCVQVMEEDALALAAGLSSLVTPSLGDISTTLGGISSNLQQLGNSRVGGLMQQVSRVMGSADSSVMIFCPKGAEGQVRYLLLPTARCEDACLTSLMKQPAAHAGLSVDRLLLLSLH